jgi:hypothetical protein
MFVIGIDPHRGCHTAAVLDEEQLGELRGVGDRRQRRRLLEWVAPFMPRVWAVEGASGTGAPCWPTFREKCRACARFFVSR